MLGRLRKIFGGSPEGRAEVKSKQAAPGDPYQASIELLQDTARNLCPDPWLANKLTIAVKTVNGAPSLETSPAESMPYIKAAYAMKKDQIPENVGVLLKGIAS